MLGQPRSGSTTQTTQIIIHDHVHAPVLSETSITGVLPTFNFPHRYVQQVEELEGRLLDVRRQLRVQRDAGHGVLDEGLMYSSAFRKERLVASGEDLPQVAALMQLRRELLGPEDM